MSRREFGGFPRRDAVQQLLALVRGCGWGHLESA
jgi:hypothetical protein